MTDWQPIATAPRDGRYFLAHAKGWPIPAFMHWDFSLGKFHINAPFNGEGEAYEVHWIPLPAPPKESDHG